RCRSSNPASPDTRGYIQSTCVVLSVFYSPNLLSNAVRIVVTRCIHRQLERFYGTETVSQSCGNFGPLSEQR
ncbi:hypothetical protein V3C99_016690, partial [Haemonchus contortus]